MSNTYKQKINQLCYRGEKVIDSETFRGLKYIIKDGHLCLMSNNNGQFTIDLRVIKDLIKEIEKICDLWGNVKTKKCIL